MERNFAGDYDYRKLFGEGTKGGNSGLKLQVPCMGHPQQVPSPSKDAAPMVVQSPDTTKGLPESNPTHGFQLNDLGQTPKLHASVSLPVKQ